MSDSYNIYSYQSRLALVAQNSTVNGTKFNVQMSVNLFSLTPNLTEIASFTVDSKGGPATTLLLKVSPQLTKFYIQYYLLGQMTNLFRDVDYSLSLSSII